MTIHELRLLPPFAIGRLGVALKGGHNAEHHNHNDVGSYVVALAGTTPLLDPGPGTAIPYGIV